MSSNITRELVEAIAKARIDHSSAKLRGMRDNGLQLDADPQFFLPWDEQPEMSKHGVREAVLGQLNELLPHLVAAGWRAPVEPAPRDTRPIEERHPELKTLRERIEAGDEAIETVKRISDAVNNNAVRDLQMELIHTIKKDPENGGHPTPEGMAGYSEGMEHGTVIMASRLNRILGGEQ